MINTESQVFEQNLDLFGMLDGVLEEASSTKKHKGHTASKEFDEDDGYCWDDDSVWQLMEGMFTLSLSYLSNCRPGNMDFNESYAWVCSSDLRHPFSFYQVSKRLGYCPDTLREQLLETTRRKFKAKGQEDPFFDQLF